MNKTLKLRFTYDGEADSAYIYLDQIEDGSVAQTVGCDDDASLLLGEVNFDLDKDGRLKGIEILGASRVLPEGLLR